MGRRSPFFDQIRKITRNFRRFSGNSSKIDEKPGFLGVFHPIFTEFSRKFASGGSPGGQIFENFPKIWLSGQGPDGVRMGSGWGPDRVPDPVPTRSRPGPDPTRPDPTGPGLDPMAFYLWQDLNGIGFFQTDSLL